MQTHLADFIKNTPQGRVADRILRTCVHCGFCTATCPTYQLLGDELDGPRGRIYLIKQMLEGAPVSAKTRLHLDRCLTCRACETTCPSGVRYGRLLEIGREVVEERAPRSFPERTGRDILRRVLSRSGLFHLLLSVGQTLRNVLPARAARRIPRRRVAGPSPTREHPRRWLTTPGCVQSALAPSINGAAARVLDRVGITLRSPPGTGCCGALSHHLQAPREALAAMRANIDAWWPSIEAGAEGIVITSSACAAMVKDYGELLAGDPCYAAKAARVAELARDLSELIHAEDAAPLRSLGGGRRVAFHSPCTLQHAQRINGVVESILTRAGFGLAPVRDAHLCCGAAGAYAVLQPTLSHRLRGNKIAALEEEAPELIATANIGCYMHLEGTARVPVAHWIELLDG